MTICLCAKRPSVETIDDDGLLCRCKGFSDFQHTHVYKTFYISERVGNESKFCLDLVDEFEEGKKQYVTSTKTRELTAITLAL